MDELIAAFLAAVSFEAGSRPDYGRIRELFIARGLLISQRGEVTDVEEFIAPRQATGRLRRADRFEETELTAVTEIFGNVAHRFSGYAEARRAQRRGVRDARRDHDPVRAHAGRLADQRDGLGRRARGAHRSRSAALSGTSWQMTQYGLPPTAKQGEEPS